MSELMQAAKDAAMMVPANDWETFTAWVLGDERRRRTTAKAADAVRNEVAAEYLEAHPPAKDESGHDVWTQPAGAFDSWPDGHTVTHDGAVWVNRLGAPNPHEPGVANSGWVRQSVPDADGVVDWAVGLAVNPGDKVRHDGAVWVAKVAHTTHDGWAPGPDTHAVWTREDEPAAEPEPEPTPPAEDTPPETEPAEPVVEDEPHPGPPEYAPGTTYVAGESIIFNGHEYRVIQGHTSAAHWPPDAAPSLYQLIK